MTLKTFQTTDDWITASVAYIETAVNQHNNASVALSGGSTPIPIYEALARTAQIHHTSVELYQTDERYIYSDDTQSNNKLIHDHLLTPSIERKNTDGSPSPFCCFTHFQTDIPIEQSLKEYEKIMRDEITFRQGLSLTILGLGPDGHTASLFPHSPAIHETENLVAHTTTDTFSIHDRLTLTFPAIMASKQLLLLVKGKQKQTILDELLHSDKTIDELPAKKLLEHPHLTIHYCAE